MTMTSVFFIRHAQSDRSAHDERTRPLTAEGLADTEKITLALKDKGITHILSSPYTRTLQTIEGLSRAGTSFGIGDFAACGQRPKGVVLWNPTSFLYHKRKRKKN